jgi:hypothetical protein
MVALLQLAITSLTAWRDVTPPVSESRSPEAAREPPRECCSCVLRARELAHQLNRRQSYRNMTKAQADRDSNVRPLASSPQFTFFLTIPVASASNARCGLRPGRNP